MFVLAFLTASLAGGTQVGIPLESGDWRKVEKKLSALEPEYLACDKQCEVRKGWGFDTCPACGGKMKKVAALKETHCYADDKEDALVWFECGFGGQYKYVIVVRLSAIDAALAEVGAKRRQKDLQINGEFQLHLGPKVDPKEAAEALSKVKGITEAKAAGNVLYVIADHADWDTIQETLKGKIDDVSWVVSKCRGVLGFISKAK